jgi:hypothetical protein
MDMNRKQFIGSLVALAATPAFAIDSRTGFERCKDDILYFVDKYLVVRDYWGNAIQLSPEQREYLKRVSTARDYFFCAKGRQVGISTANNVFVYWKNLFFPGHKVWIVEPNMAMAKRVGELFANVSNTGGFQPDPDRIHFVSPHALTCVDWHDRNNTLILDEFAWWSDGASSFDLYMELYNSICANGQKLNNIIAVSTPSDHHDLFSILVANVGNSRRMTIPSPISGLEA